MSAKGRGSDVVEHEFYGTPAWCTRRILEALPSHIPESWLEPCAGSGAITGVLHRRWAGDTHAPLISAGDIRDLPRPPGVSGAWAPGSSFTIWPKQDSDAVITNPPFSLAPDIIEHFLPRCDWLILLLRASFKLARWRDNMPDEFKLPQRPEFVASLSCKVRDDSGKSQPGCGWSAKLAVSDERPTWCPACGQFGGPATTRHFVQCSTTDASEYSWFVWTPERGRKFGRVSVLPDTSLEERRADR